MKQKNVAGNDEDSRKRLNVHRLDREVDGSGHQVCQQEVGQAVVGDRLEDEGGPAVVGVRFVNGVRLRFHSLQMS